MATTAQLEQTAATSVETAQEAKITTSPYVPTKDLEEWGNKVLAHLNKMSTDEKYCKAVEKRLYGQNL